MSNRIEVIAEKPLYLQSRYYCNYCRIRKALLYLWRNGSLIGIGSSLWLYCSQCKKTYKKGIYGISQEDLDCKVKVSK